MQYSLGQELSSLDSDEFSSDSTDSPLLGGSASSFHLYRNHQPDYLDQIKGKSFCKTNYQTIIMCIYLGIIILLIGATGFLVLHDDFFTPPPQYRPRRLHPSTPPIFPASKRVVNQTPTNVGFAPLISPKKNPMSNSSSVNNEEIPAFANIKDENGILLRLVDFGPKMSHGINRSTFLVFGYSSKSQVVNTANLTVFNNDSNQIINIYTLSKSEELDPITKLSPHVNPIDYKQLLYLQQSLLSSINSITAAVSNICSAVQAISIEKLLHKHETYNEISDYPNTRLLDTIGSNSIFPSQPILFHDQTNLGFNHDIVALPKTPQNYRYLTTKHSFLDAKEIVKRFPGLVRRTTGGTMISTCYSDWFPEDWLTENGNLDHQSYIDLARIPRQEYEQLRLKWFYGLDANIVMPYHPKLPPFPLHNPKTRWRHHCVTPWLSSQWKGPFQINSPHLPHTQPTFILGEHSTRIILDSCGRLSALYATINDFATRRVGTSANRLAEINAVMLANNEPILSFSQLPHCEMYYENFLVKPYNVIGQLTSVKAWEDNWLLIPQMFGNFFNFALMDLLQQAIHSSSKSDPKNDTVTYDELSNTVTISPEIYSQYSALLKDHYQTNSTRKIITPLAFIKSSSPLSVFYHFEQLIVENGFLSGETNSQTINTTMIQYCVKYWGIDEKFTHLENSTPPKLIKTPDRAYTYVYITNGIVFKNPQSTLEPTQTFHPLAVFMDPLTLQITALYHIEYTGHVTFDRFCKTSEGKKSLEGCIQERNNAIFDTTFSLIANETPLTLQVEKERGTNFQKTRFQTSPEISQQFLLQSTSYYTLDTQFFLSLNIDDRVTYLQEINLEKVYSNRKRCDNISFMSVYN